MRNQRWFWIGLAAVTVVAGGMWVWLGRGHAQVGGRTGERTPGNTAAKEEGPWRSEPRPEDIVRVGLRKGLATMPDYLEGDHLLNEALVSELKKMSEKELLKKEERLEQLMNKYSGPTNRMPDEVQEAPDVVVWREEQAWPVMDALGAIREPGRALSDPSDLFPKEENDLVNWRGIRAAGDAPLLIVATGSLSGLTAASPEREDLRAYAEKGGIVFAMAQPMGSDFAALPTPEGETLEAVGYRQDVSNQVPVVRAADHPMLFWFPGTMVNLKVDGLFLRYPRQSTVLLRRADSGLPCLLLYPLGKGWIVVSSAFQMPCDEDSLRANPRLAPQLAGLAAWAKGPSRPIPSHILGSGGPEGTLAIDLAVRNVTDQPGNAVEYAVQTPERGGEVLRGTASVAVPAHGETTLALKLNLGGIRGAKQAVPGIYHVDYRIVKRRLLWHTVIQPWAETNSGRFALVGPEGRPPEPPTTYFTAWGDQDDPDRTQNLVYLYVQDATGTPRDFHVWTNYSTERPILLDSFHLEPYEQRIFSYPYDLTRLGSYHFWLLDPVVGTPSTPQSSAEWGGEPWKLVGKRWVVMHH